MRPGVSLALPPIIHSATRRFLTDVVVAMSERPKPTSSALNLSGSLHSVMARPNWSALGKIRLHTLPAMSSLRHMEVWVKRARLPTAKPDDTNKLIVATAVFLWQSASPSQQGLFRCSSQHQCTQSCVGKTVVDHGEEGHDI